jgi:primosomal replication protein N
MDKDRPYICWSVPLQRMSELLICRDSFLYHSRLLAQCTTMNCAAAPSSSDCNAQTDTHLANPSACQSILQMLSHCCTQHHRLAIWSLPASDITSTSAARTRNLTHGVYLECVSGVCVSHHQLQTPSLHLQTRMHKEPEHLKCSACPSTAVPSPAQQAMQALHAALSSAATTT